MEISSLRSASSLLSESGLDMLAFCMRYCICSAAQEKSLVAAAGCGLTVV